jgi:hypothetical protein
MIQITKLESNEKCDKLNFLSSVFSFLCHLLLLLLLALLRCGFDFDWCWLNERNFDLILLGHVLLQDFGNLEFQQLFKHLSRLY